MCTWAHKYNMYKVQIVIKNLPECSILFKNKINLLTYLPLLATRFQAVDPTLYTVTSLWFAVSSREFTNQNLCKT